MAQSDGSKQLSGPTVGAIIGIAVVVIVGLGWFFMRPKPADEGPVDPNTGMTSEQKEMMEGMQKLAPTNQ